MDNKTMKTVDMPKDFKSFTPSDQYYIKKFESLNAGRAGDIKHMRTRNKRAAILLGGVVAGIYLYTIFSVKQEKFLDFGAESTKESE